VEEWKRKETQRKIEDWRLAQKYVIKCHIDIYLDELSFVF
jgi:hypothetical protein